MSDPIRLHLGCGNVRLDGFVNIDYVKTDAVDVLCDLSLPDWPWADNSVEYATSSHVIEHLPMREDITLDGFVVFFNELGRVLQPGGRAEIRAPYGKSQRAFQDPTHRRFIVENSFLYLSKAWRDGNGLDHYPITCDLASVTISLDGMNGDVMLRHPEVQQRMTRTDWDAAADIVAILEKPVPVAAESDTM